MTEFGERYGLPEMPVSAGDIDLLRQELKLALEDVAELEQSVQRRKKRLVGGALNKLYRRAEAIKAHIRGVKKCRK